MEHAIHSPVPRSSGFTPPLTIRFVLAWVAITATTLTLRLWFLDAFDDGPRIDEIVVFMRTNSVLLALLAGPTIASIFAWPLWRRQGYAFPVHAGDWLLIIVGLGSGFATLRVLFVQLMGAVNVDDLSDSAYTIFLTAFAAMSVFIVLVIVIAAKRVASQRWRVALTLLALATSIPAGRLVIEALAMYLAEDSPYQFHLDEAFLMIETAEKYVLSMEGGLLALPVLVAACIDLRSKESCAWAHWFGIVAFLAERGLSVGYYLFRAFLLYRYDLN
jgi:hypothetical protein